MTVAAVAIWGATAWGLLAPQQHRLVSVAHQSAPVVLGLNTSGTYLGMTAAGVIGAISIPVFGAHKLGYIGAIIVAISIIVAQLASAKIQTTSQGNNSVDRLPT